MKDKKILKVLAIILSTVIILIITYLVMIHFDGFLNKDNRMTRTEIISLLEKGKEYTNYYYCPTVKTVFGATDEYLKTEIYIKDDIEKTIVDGKPLNWTNFKTREIITIMGEHNGKKMASISNLDSGSFETNEYSQHGFDYSTLAREDIFNTDYEYLGEEEIDGRNTIIVKVWNKDGLKINSTKYYIDKETGLIIKRVDYMTLGLVKIICDRNIKMDTVTDADVERPNLDGYEVFE